MDKYQNSFMKEKASLKLGDVVKEPKKAEGKKSEASHERERERKIREDKGGKNRRSRAYFMKEKWSP